MFIKRQVSNQLFCVGRSLFVYNARPDCCLRIKPLAITRTATITNASKRLNLKDFSRWFYQRMSNNPDDYLKPADDTKNASVRYVEVDTGSEGQRLDNFLLKELKGAPRSLIYRILRKGEVRVNKKRAKPLQKLKAGDSIRIPPVRLQDKANQTVAPGQGLRKLLLESVIYEDDYLLIINKPSGLAVHGGSGLSLGLIESLREMNLGASETGKTYLELVHRLDRETSGCLVLARKRATLVALHEIIREGKIKKIYQTLVVGNWPRSIRTVDAPLKKNELASGERVVKVNTEGKAATTHFHVKEALNGATLLEIDLDTGRTHQIRVHTQLTGHPVLGDSKYGSKESQQFSKSIGLKRLFLHASCLKFRHPETGRMIVAESPLPSELSKILEGLKD